MTLQPFSVVSGFVAAVQGLVAASLLALVVRARRADPSGAAEDRGPLLAWTAFVVAALSLASWPLLYLWLQSLVPLWPDVMCIQGVTRVGTGDPGPARFFPGLVAAAQLCKPALVFLAGTWLVLHRLDRRTRSAPLAARLRGVLGLLALVALADAVVGLAAVAIPKEDRSLSVGCCTFAGVARAETAPWPFSSRSPRDAAPLALGVHLGIAAALLAAQTWWAARAARGAPAGRPAAVAAGLAVASVPVAVAALSTVVAPHLLGRPDHFCAYCALAQAPESVLGVALFVLGTCATGWAALVAYGARHAETAPFAAAHVAGLLRTARVCVAGAAFFVVGAMVLP